MARKGIQIETADQNLEISLEPVDITLGEVVVTAEPSAEEIVRRAIQRKTVNRERIKTFSGLLYSKLTFEIDGNVFGEIEDKDRKQVRESFSRVFRDNEAEITHITIEQRRQTANVTPDDNLLAITNFYSFYHERFRIANAVITTPLADDALDSYEFTLRERFMLEDRVAWTLDFKPRSDVFPGFIGTMTIVSGTYDLVEIEATPSVGTAIRYINDLAFHQKFDRVADSIWTPTYLNTSGSGSVTIVAGIAEVGGRLTATSFYKDVEVNIPLPDSIYAQERIVSVAPQADSSSMEFWDRNSPARLSQREANMYREVDSLVREARIEAGDPIEESVFRFNFGPQFLFNRASGATPGLDVSLAYDPLRLSGEAFYGFGSEQFYGEATLSGRLASWADGNLWASASIFSSLGVQPGGETFFREANSFTAGLLSMDHYDYFERHGWQTGLTMRHNRLRVDANFGIERNYSIVQNVGSGLFNSTHTAFDLNGFHPNPEVNDGAFKLLGLTATWGNYDVNLSISTQARFNYSAKIEAIYGEHASTGERFRVLDGGIRADIPTFSSGYVPMTLNVAIKGGIADNNTPAQQQFVMPTRLRVFGRTDQFATGGPGVFGGNKYAAVFVRHNFTDLWWRVLGLPTYEGRGLDLSLFFNSGLYEQETATGYRGMADRVHSEVGFGIGKIPIFISNVFFLGFDAGWSVSGPLGNDFGYTFTLTSPF